MRIYYWLAPAVSNSQLKPWLTVLSRQRSTQICNSWNSSTWTGNCKFIICSTTISIRIRASQNSCIEIQSMDFKDWKWVENGLKTRIKWSEISKGPSLYYVRVFWGFLEPPTPYVRTFSLHKVRENCHFLDHPPTAMSLRNIKMTPYVIYC